MAEWSKAAVLKTVEVHASVGSNPTPSANKIAAQFYVIFLLAKGSEKNSSGDFESPVKKISNILGEMAELAEGARLLSEYGGYTPSWVRIPFSPPF